MGTKSDKTYFGTSQLYAKYNKASRTDYIHHSHGGYCVADIVVDLLIAEIRLREQMQIKEHLLSDFGAHQSKDFDTDADLPPYNDKLEQVRREISIRVLDLYHHELRLPSGPIRQMYYKLREDPKWYLRGDLVNDCIHRDGCCARNCSCCKKRQLNSQTRKGIGHCTVECGCCARYRSFEFTDEDKQKFTEDTEKLLRDSSNRCHLYTMIHAFFCEPKPRQSPPKQITHVLPQNNANKASRWRLWIRKIAS